MMNLKSCAPSVAMALLFVLSMLTLTASVLAEEPDIRSVRSGDWSDPATWRPQRVPGEGDQVRIGKGTRVRYDAQSDAVIRSIHVAGTLRFARDRDTLLNVGVMRVQGPTLAPNVGEVGVEDVPEGADAPERPDDGVLAIGAPDAPIPPEHTARIRLNHITGMDEGNAPAIVARPGGRMEFHGAPLRRTWVELDAEAEAGDRTVTVGGPLDGWRVGDTVIVTGSKHHRSGRSFRYTRQELQTERRRVEAIDGRTITLDAPLEHPHFGGGDYRSEVANLSRNVIVESADPDGVRGHTMYHRHSAGAISYARFAHLGKEGVLGRYPIHFHRVRDTMRGSSVIGAAIVDSHNRWVTIHNTQYLVVRDCVGYRSVGHGFFLEDGTEVYNVLDRNLGVQAFRGDRMRNQALPFDPNDGGAFWWANGRNTFVRNVACENDRYGFRYDSQKRSNFDSRIKVRAADGERRRIDIRTIPIYRFEDNETHTEGLYGMAFAGTEGVGPDDRHPHRLKDLTIWQVHYALRAQLPMMLMEHVDIQDASYGVYRPWFDHHVYRDLRIADTGAEPFNRGLDDKSRQHGPIAVDGLRFDEVGYGRRMPLIQISANNVDGDAESHFRDVSVSGRDGPEHWPLVNLGGGPRLEPETPKGVPVYIHDWYGPGRDAKVVSTRADDLLNDGHDYHKDPPLTGDESVAAEVGDVPFPEVLRPTDEHPPATVITMPRDGFQPSLDDGTLVVRGTTTDNTRTQRVLVNGVEAESVDYNFHRWKVTLRDVEPGRLTISAHAVDAHGNTEQTPHRMSIVVGD